jgi:phospholipid transport system substrate-binding protein
MLRRFASILAFVVVAAAQALTFPAVAENGPTDFIRTLGNQAIEVIRSSASPDQKRAFFHKVLHQDFDLSSISPFVLGPYWRQASEAQRQEFKLLLENHLVSFYGRRFTQYNGESLQVTGSRTEPRGAVVTSQMIRLQGPPIEVDWRLSNRGGFYRITDVSIDGVSMALTHRSEFAELIQRNGGQIAGLLTAVREESGGGVGSSTPRR